jgi:hypothetical protein
MSPLDPLPTHTTLPVQPKARPAAAAAPAGEASPTLGADALTLKTAAVDGPGAAGALPWVKAQGSRLVDASGKDVSVRGVNLGGWLVQEPWMMPLSHHPDDPAIKDQATLWRTVEARFGTEKMTALREAYRKAWLGPEDFATMKAAGFTTVRLPFTYDTLQEPDGYKWLDWAIAEAAKNGMYTVLDLHGAPGGQSKEMHTGEEGVNRFFKDDANVEKAASMWRDVAKRYANRPEVIGYDLLNEPMGAKDAAQLHAVHDRLYDAIRSVDPKHLVIMEDGYKGISTFPKPEKYGWQNVAYSVHQYNFGAKNTDAHLDSLEGMLKKIDRVQRAKNVPVYMGEFNVPDANPDRLERFVEKLGDAQVPWSMWSYKAILPHSSPDNVWGMVRNEGDAATLDVRRDSEAELLRKIELMRTEHLKPVPGAIATFQDEAAKADAFVRPHHSALSNLAVRVQDAFWSAVIGVGDRLRGLFGGRI